MKGLCKHQFSRRYFFSYKDIEWDRRQWECLCVFFTATDKESGVKDTGESPLRCEHWPSCEFKSISETPRSLTWHGAVLFPWLGCRYLPTIPQDHGASLSQLCSDSLAFDIASYWWLPRQTGGTKHLCRDEHNQLYLSAVFVMFSFSMILVHKVFLRLHCYEQNSSGTLK